MDLSRFLKTSLLLALSAAASVAQTPPAEKKGTMLLDLKKIIPAEPKAPEAPKPAPEAKPEAPAETPQQRFKRIKADAEAGTTQSQYELGLFYAQDFERVVPLDYYEAIAWFQKAAGKNHRMAQLQLGRFYELGRGMETRNLQEAFKWRRSSALLGCKQSQRWMTQLYVNTFNGAKAFEGVVTQDISNLIEAYAWACLAAEQNLTPRDTLNTPTAEEVGAGHALTSRDYSFEKGTAGAAEQDRDNIAKNPKFSKKVSEEAKERAIALKKEAEAHQKANTPK